MTTEHATEARVLDEMGAPESWEYMLFEGSPDEWSARHAALGRENVRVHSWNRHQADDGAERLTVHLIYLPEDAR